VKKWNARIAALCCVTANAIMPTQAGSIFASPSAQRDNGNLIEIDFKWVENGNPYNQGIYYHLIDSISRTASVLWVDNRDLAGFGIACTDNGHSSCSEATYRGKLEAVIRNYRGPNLIKNFAVSSLLKAIAVGKSELFMSNFYNRQALLAPKIGAEICPVEITIRTPNQLRIAFGGGLIAKLGYIYQMQVLSLAAEYRDGANIFDVHFRSPCDYAADLSDRLSRIMMSGDTFAVDRNQYVIVMKKQVRDRSHD